MNATATPALPRENVFGHTRKLKIVLERVRSLGATLGRTLRILDVGCGNGLAVTRHIAGANAEILAIDLHAPSIEYARRTLQSAKLQFRLCRIEDLAAHERDYDVVVLSDVLEHVHDPHGLLQAAAARLADHGVLLLSVPNGRGPFEIESALSRVRLLGPVLLKATDTLVAVLNRWVVRGAWTRAVEEAGDAPYNIECGHVQFFSRRELLCLIADCGLEVVARHNLSWLSGPFTNYLFAPWQGFCRWNSAMADRLPMQMVSAWLLELQHPARAIARAMPMVVGDASK